MRSSTRFLGVLLISPALAIACGGSDNASFGPSSNGGKAGAMSATGGADASSGTGGGSGVAGSGTGAAGSGTGGNSGGGADSGSAGTSGGTAGVGGNGAGGTSPSCATITCKAPATCDGSGAAPKCVCPAGYTDTKGDGSQCDDIDECAKGTAGCDPNATCKNTVGSFTCTCNAPAYTGDGKTCACAAGYASDGGTCLKADAQTCAKDGDCATEHCVAGTCCTTACNQPGACETAAGATCSDGKTCTYGKMADNTACAGSTLCSTFQCFQGACVAKTAKNCNDNNQCTTDACTPATGVCTHTTVVAATACDDGNPCTTDTCNTATGCVHTSNNAGTCTDNNPCTTDVCSSGVCVSTAKDCSSFDNGCNKGVCTGGTCAAQPTNANGACSDALGVCDATGKCNATGKCIGDDDACGALAATCASCASGAGCFNGRLCTCITAAAGQPPNIVVNGVCQPDTNECNAKPCSALATCVDPTPNGSKTGDFVCTCPKGYTGNGVGVNGCADINECATANPCGAGVAPGGCNGLSPPGSYSCTCAAGYVSVPGPTGPECSCDLSGSYALVATSTVTWNAIDFGPIPVIEASPPVDSNGNGGVQTTSWSLRYQTISNGTLTVQTIPCGGTTPDLCDTAFGDTNAQYQPNEVWGDTGVDSGFPKVQTNLAGVIPGGAYNEPQTVALMGITLANPAGPWPPCFECVNVPAGQTCMCPGAATAYTVTNFAQFVDADGDGHSAITTIAVPAGGISIDGAYPDPPVDYTEPSECPRLTKPPGGYAYGAWPGFAGGFFNTDQWYGASRIISTVKGSTITFDNTAKQCLVSGTIVGPAANGQLQTDARIAGCETSAAAACTKAQVDSYDDVAQTQQLHSVKFTLNKLPSINLAPILAMADGSAKEAALNQACAEVRASFCPAGKTCK